MINCRHTSVAEETARMEFAKKAAAHFAAHQKHTSYTDGNIEPGAMLALRWGCGNDCVLVLKLDEIERPVLFAQIIQEPAPAAVPAAAAGVHA